MTNTQKTIEEVEAKIAENAEARITLPKYKNKKVGVVVDCWKCVNRSGRYGHAGVCWACGGTGVKLTTGFEKVFPEGSTDAQIAAWTEEIERRAETRRLKKQLSKLVIKNEKEVAAVVSANEVIDSTPGLVDALKHDHDISRDLREKLFKFGTLSEKQIALAFRLVEQDKKRAEEDAKALDAPAGRHIVSGVVLSVKTKWSQFGDVEKMLVKDERGFKVYATVPSSMSVEKGDSITIKVTLKPSNDDSKFAFGSRPSAA